MPTAPTPDIAALLKSLLPMERLSTGVLQKLKTRSRLVTLDKGKPVFQVGKADRHTIYLLQGALLLQTTEGKKSLLKAGTSATKSPIHNFQPRRCSAWTSLPSQLLLIDSEALDQAITWEQVSSAGVEVERLQHSGTTQQDIEPGEQTVDWMSLMLQAPAFAKLPPSNFQALFMRMEEISLRPGEVVIKQGDPGDFFYIIKSGSCQVSRNMENNKVLPLAILKAGDSFGEEALLTEAPRNANVVAKSKTKLMRLAKKDFNQLLKDPMIQWVSREDAEAQVEKGAKWLDVRLENEHKETGIAGSINIPLYMLRLKMKQLNPDIKYVVYCDTGRRSTAASFLLAERDISACCLRGGLHNP